MKNDPESFERTEYGDTDGADEVAKYAAIKQVLADLEKKSPNQGLVSRFEGNQLKLVYHCYEMLLNDRQRLLAVEDQGEKFIREAVKVLKKEARSRFGISVKLTEKKDLANHSVEKVSLNQRYYYRAWKVFDLG